MVKKVKSHQKVKKHLQKKKNNKLMMKNLKSWVLNLWLQELNY
jgi:hypothetical protein